MNFQNTLLKRKGRFGIIWLAAHNITKISKSEIIHLNISDKCSEIVEFVLNGRENRPRFSLVISSHLMYGLCVLVKKQQQYLYDDLIYLKQEIHKCYINEKLIFKKDKTPKKIKAKQLDKSAITLKENLPELITSFETVLEQETERLRQELEEREEVFKKPEIPITLIEESFEPTTVIQAEDFQFGSEMAFLHAENLQDTYFNIENLEKTKVTSTAKMTDRIQPRIPFRELSTNEQYRRAELTTSVAQAQETSIYDELESLLMQKKTEISENIPPTVELQQPVAIPELYQETIFEPQALAETTIEIPIVPLPTSAEVPAEPTPTEIIVQPIGPTVVEEIIQVQPEIELTKTTVRRQKKRGLIIDEVTKISQVEMSKRLRKKEDYDLEEMELSQLFAKTRQKMKFQFDYLSQDLLKQPSNILMRKTKRIYSTRDFNKFVQTKMILPLLKPNKLIDDQYFYTTEAIRYEPTTTTLISLDLEQRREVEESRTRRQKRESSSRVESQSENISSKILKDSTTGETIINIEDSHRMQFQEQTQLESFAPLEIPMVYVQPPTPQKIDQNKYEKFILDIVCRMKESNKIVSLQEIIKETDLKEIGVQSRRKLGIQLFQQVLIMSKDKKLEPEQTQTYGNITLRLI